MRMVISKHARKRLREVYGSRGDAVARRARAGLMTTLRCGAKVQKRGRGMRVYVYLPGGTKAAWALEASGWVMKTVLRSDWQRRCRIQCSSSPTSST